MTAEAASALGIRTVVLAEHADDPATGCAGEVVLGSPGDWLVLAELARRCDVIAFDHELVDLELLAHLESEGTLVRPGTGTLRVAVDKSVMRQTFDDAGLPVPAYRNLGLLPADDAAAAIG